MVFLYIDMGAGSLLLQAAIASALAVPFILRTRLRRVVNRVRGRKSSQEESSIAP